MNSKICEEKCNVDAIQVLDPTMLLDKEEYIEFLEEYDIIKIRKADEKLVLIGCDSNVFYGALRSKLNWSGGPLA